MALHKKGEEPAIVHDIWDAILNDSWMWGVVWGPPRVGKTTFKMDVGFEVYHDWDKVLKSFVWNLSGMLYKMKAGQPERIWTRNQMHNRIPLLLYDDFGYSSNKAETQHDFTWDILKGGWDVLGTKIAVVLASMVDPTEPTFQIMNKYTHEVFIPVRGTYKYDRVEWGQDFKGWKAHKSKKWVETSTFNSVPGDVYKEYDEMRMSLVDELDQRLQDAMADNQIERILKRLTEKDLEFLELVDAKGQIERHKASIEWHEQVVRAKARSLIVPVAKGTGYWYDLTDLGFELVRTVREQRGGNKAPALGTETTALDVVSPQPNAPKFPLKI